MTSFALASDFHGMFERISWPKADFLLIAGDVLANYVPYGGNLRLETAHQMLEMEKLGQFLRGLECYKHIVVVFGNHDWASQLAPEEEVRAQLGKGITYLRDQEVTIDGFKIYGSPWVPQPQGPWAWCFPDKRENPARARAHAQACWEQIPVDTDILITHSPPFQVLDSCFGGEVGCPWLRERLDQLETLKLHVFGHIHPSSGVVNKPYEKCSPVSVNAAICDDLYQTINPVRVVEVNKG